jgi:hypothetical protein
LCLFFHMTISTFTCISPSFVAVIASTVTLPSPLGSSYRVRASTDFVSCDFMNFTQSVLHYFTRVSSSIVKF